MTTSNVGETLVRDIMYLSQELHDMRRRKDEAYTERNRVVAFLAKILNNINSSNVSVCKTSIEGWDPEWHGCVFIESPVGQLSWHFHDDDAYLFKDLPQREAVWDGHTTDEKYSLMEKY